jgi:hypothetical protein
MFVSQQKINISYIRTYLGNLTCSIGEGVKLYVAKKIPVCCHVMPDVSKHTMTDNIFTDSRSVMNFGGWDWQISRLSRSSDVIEEFGACDVLL